MATTAETLPGGGTDPARRVPLATRLNPTICFWIAAMMIYGGVAAYAATGHFLDQTPRDIWQHIAALRALIENPFAPANPFVPGTDGSRHFHPWWVAMALVARAFGWNEWQALAFAGFVSSAVFASGIFTFARALFRDAWAPMALLVAFVFSWSLPVSHTGFHSIQTLVEGVGYPAALLIGLSLHLWSLTIHALEKPRWAFAIVPLAAFMLATHQLGAGIGFITASAFILFQPDASLRNRAIAASGIGAGILLACAWPYHSPFDAIARTGNPTWTGGMDFYGPLLLSASLLPSFIGLWGLLDRTVARRLLPVTASMLAFGGIFILGNMGFLIATRFLMPAVLMLHIGVASLLLILPRRWQSMPKPAQLGLFAFGVACVAFHLGFTGLNSRLEARDYRANGDASAALGRLTADVPDTEPVAAWDVAAWPLAAVGQRVSSVPWPEPMIDRLDLRQADTERLFDPSLSREERLAIARRWGVKTLVLDGRGPIRREMPKELRSVLTRQSVYQARDGVFFRFDLE